MQTYEKPALLWRMQLGCSRYPRLFAQVSGHGALRNSDGEGPGAPSQPAVDELASEASMA